MVGTGIIVPNSVPSRVPSANPSFVSSYVLPTVITSRAALAKFAQDGSETCVVKRQRTGILVTVAGIVLVGRCVTTWYSFLAGGTSAKQQLL